MKTTYSRINWLLAMLIASVAHGQAVAEESGATIKLARVEGNVMVNQGVNYTRAQPGTTLKTGAKVITAKGASVAVVYKDGCIKQLKENSILTVGPATECTAMKTNERIYLAEALGETATDAPSAGAGSLGGGEVGGAGESIYGSAATGSGAGISSGMIFGGLSVAGAAMAVSGHRNGHHGNNGNDRNASAQ